jgi:hypothetical protein
MFDHRQNRAAALSVIAVLPLTVIASAAATVAISVASTLASVQASSTSSNGCGEDGRLDAVGGSPRREGHPATRSPRYGIT